MISSRRSRVQTGSLRSESGRSGRRWGRNGGRFLKRLILKDVERRLPPGIGGQAGFLAGQLPEELHPRPAGLFPHDRQEDPLTLTSETD